MYRTHYSATQTQGQGQEFNFAEFTLEFRVRSISPLTMERFSLKDKSKVIDSRLVISEI